jgi:8-oxo-dGTP pyrophosphatase MutT (NUDIX family)
MPASAVLRQKISVRRPGVHGMLSLDSRPSIASRTRRRKDHERMDLMVMQRSHWRTRLEPWLRHAFHLYWRFARGMTLGVRGVVLDSDGRVFLVKHSYVSGWHLPGGGVEVGETFVEALTRELFEEGRIALAGEPELHGIFLNSHVSRRDHVAVFVVRAFSQDRPPAPNGEIVATGFFAADALPDDTTLGTRLRISEVLDGAKPILTWRSP